MFDDLMDSLGDFNQAALMIALVAGVVLIIFLIGDPFNTGMDAVPIGPRIISIVLIIPLSYFIANKMINR